MDKKRKLKKKNQGRGGKRKGSGRKPNPDAPNRTFVTVFLRKDTVQLLRSLAGSRYIGALLQQHLDRFPPRRFSARPILSPEEKEKRRISKLSKIDLRFERTLRKLQAQDDLKKAKAAKVAA